MYPFSSYQRAVPSLFLQKVDGGYKTIERESVSPQDFFGRIFQAAQEGDFKKVKETYKKYSPDSIKYDAYYTYPDEQRDIITLLNSNDPGRAEKTKAFIEISKRYPDTIVTFCWDLLLWEAVCAFDQKDDAKVKECTSAILSDLSTHRDSYMYSIEFRIAHLQERAVKQNCSETAKLLANFKASIYSSKAEEQGLQAGGKLEVSFKA